MEYKKKSLIYRISYFIFNLLLVLTMFLPTISLDKYVEYDFSNGYYNESYQSHITPVATNISPIMFIKSLFADRKDYSRVTQDFTNKKIELSNALNTGQITKDKFDELVAKAPETGNYYVHGIKFNTIDELSRLSNKIFMFSCVIFAFYAVTIIMLIVNFINCLSKKKLLSVANVYGGWLQAALMLLVQLFTFSFALSSQNIIENITKNTLTEEITYAATPKFLSILILCLLVIHAIICTIQDKKDTKMEKQYKEIPKYLTDKLQKNKNTNRYRKINPKKSKYKHGYKKKH